MTHEPATIQGMIAALHHGGLGYSIIYFDRELGTIKSGVGDFTREDGENDKCFLRRVKRLVLAENDESDVVITVSN